MAHSRVCTAARDRPALAPSEAAQRRGHRHDDAARPTGILQQLRASDERRAPGTDCHDGLLTRQGHHTERDSADRCGGSGHRAATQSFPRGVSTCASAAVRRDDARAVVLAMVRALRWLEITAQSYGPPRLPWQALTVGRWSEASVPAVRAVPGAVGYAPPVARGGIRPRIPCRGEHRCGHSSDSAACHRQEIARATVSYRVAVRPHTTWRLGIWSRQWSGARKANVSAMIRFAGRTEVLRPNTWLPSRRTRRAVAGQTRHSGQGD